ncbi:MAG: glycerophosphodiester phosphodiesterase family protein [Bacteroidales bacterium]
MMFPILIAWLFFPAFYSPSSGGDFSGDRDPVSGDSDPIFVAHRGASYLAPENTLASVRLAWELGADAAECDVMLTSDHRVILFHDKNTGSLTGEDLVVSETGWKKLSQLTIRLRDSNLSKYAQERIPLLSEVLETIPADRMLVIEIKTGQEILPFLKQVIDAHWHSGRISFICFDLETILATKRLFPEQPCYFLSSFRSGVIRHFDEILRGSLDGVNVRHKAVNKNLVQRCRAEGLEVWCWTVNKPEDARKMKALGVSAITTDRPKWLKEQI